MLKQAAGLGDELPLARGQSVKEDSAQDDTAVDCEGVNPK